MSVLSAPFHTVLEGSGAFYALPDYAEETHRDFVHVGPLPAIYAVNTESKIIRVFKRVVSVILFPIFIYQALHSLVGRIGIVPASRPDARTRHRIETIRDDLPCSKHWMIKRFTVEVDGHPIDAAIMGRPSTLDNGRWVLSSLGNGEFYEEFLREDQGLKGLLDGVKGNVLLFNYPGVPDGWPDRSTLVKAYRAMLSFLEDENGIRARQIVGFGHSLGGAVQAEALEGYQLKEGIQYVFVKSRTFSNLSALASEIMGGFFGFLVQFFGWNMDVASSSKKLQAPEIILQTANVNQYERLHDSRILIDDGVIRAKTSLGKALLDDPHCPKEHKIFLGIPEGHNDGISDPATLAATINGLLR